VFSQNGEATEISELNATARRVREAFAKNTLILVALLSLLPNESVAASWSEAESAFASALAMPVGSRQATAFYTKSALLFEATAQTNDDAASAFYNAGNAWFQANKLGLAITAYRNAARIRPFDEALLDNLAAARALTLNKVSDDRSILERAPSSWLRVVTIVMSFCFCGLMLLCTRYESRYWRLLSYASAMVLALSVVILVVRLNGSLIEGVIITDSVEARKGPAYAYAPAFVQALHDGLEFKLIEERGAWMQIELADGRRCWIPKNQASRLPAL
jgi:tetratricopeptide (TPR) repeat protein